MNPIYKFELSDGNTGQIAFPVYKDDLSKDFEKESGQEFFREKLSGKLTFVRQDYTFIVSKAFDTEFGVEISISYDGGETWESYWAGTFYKTDCEFDADSQTVIVNPKVSDLYADVLAGLDKEFNLIDLSPEIAQVYADKRPIIQMYIPGQSSIACFMGGSWWEQECEIVNESDTVEIEGNTVNKLTGYFLFNKIAGKRTIQTSGVASIPDLFMGDIPVSNFTDFTYTTGSYKFIYRAESTGSGVNFYYEIARVSDSVVMWRYWGSFDDSHTVPPFGELSYNLDPVSGTGASGTVVMTWQDLPVYARYICDVDEINNVQTFKIPVDDLTGSNPNYHYVFPYGRTTVVFYGTEFTQTPNKWGLYQPGQYYLPPQVSQNPELFPISRNAWGRVSVWFTFFRFDYADDVAGRKQFVLKNAYPLSSVISVLLAQFTNAVTHEATTDYSQFLYGENILNVTQTLMITPKSNVVSAGYDQPAQNAPITLRQIFDMLRDCFRCYWFIDADGRLRVEHIEYFRKGGSYSTNPTVGIDLTARYNTRNGKTLAFGLDKYAYDKPEMASRYQFGWMDNVTEYFNGLPIDIVSKFVNPDLVEQISVSAFTSDIDYILMNPGGVSKDGFVLLAPQLDSGRYVLPYYNFMVGISEHRLQNGYVAFYFLEHYYVYDMPAPSFKINGVTYTAQGVKKLKTQSVNFPALNDPDLVQLVKTNIGNGTIEKLSLNLSSRNAKATLIYDTQ